MKAVVPLILVALAVANVAVSASEFEPKFNGWAAPKWASLASDLEYAKVRLAKIADADVPRHITAARGIVITAANAQELSWAVASIRVLRVHSTLPVELVHNDLTTVLVQQVEEALKGADVRIVNVDRMLSGYTGVRSVTLGLQMYAVMHSAFQQVLFLDPATTLVSDPSPLFARLAHTGGVFFGTEYKANLDNPVFELLSLPAIESYTQDATFFLVDVSKAWSALTLATTLTSSPLYQTLLDGNTDALRLAFETRQVTYDFITGSTALLAVKSESGAVSCAAFRSFGTKENGVVAVFSINGRVSSAWNEVGHTCPHSGTAALMENVLPGVHATLVAAHERSLLNTNECHRYDPRDIYGFIKSSESEVNLAVTPKGQLVAVHHEWHLRACGWLRCGSGVDFQDANIRFYNFSTRSTPRSLDIGALRTVMSYANQTIVQVFDPRTTAFTCVTNNRPEGSIVTDFYIPAYSWVVVSIAWDPYYEPWRYSLMKVISFASR